KTSCVAFKNGTQIIKIEDHSADCRIRQHRHQNKEYSSSSTLCRSGRSSWYSSC
uniref:Uncharacterized protein n=1 Tax=Anabas testudineus TaxID=64144 RepID=A0A7N6FKI7_ANATE